METRDKNIRILKPRGYPTSVFAFGYTFRDVESETIKSRYNFFANRKSRLNPITLRVLEYALPLMHGDRHAAGGIGKKENLIYAEYPAIYGKPHCVIYDRAKGTFQAGIYHEYADTFAPYRISDEEQNGEALLFALIPILAENAEFRECIDRLYLCFPDDYATIRKTLLILCDNIYRRTKGSSALGSEFIPIFLPSNGVLAPITQEDYESAFPETVLYGTLKKRVPKTCNTEKGGV